MLSDRFKIIIKKTLIPLTGIAVFITAQAFAFPKNSMTVLPGESSPVVMAVQQAMKEKDAYDGIADGYFGIRTEEALASLGLNPKKINAKTLKKLSVDDADIIIDESMIERSFDKYRMETGAEEYALGDSGDTVMEVQEMLSSMGYYEAEPNGVFGRDTFMALKAFSDDCGIAFTGTITEGLSEFMGSQDMTARVATDKVSLGFANSANATVYYEIPNIIPAEVEIWDEKYATYMYVSENGTESVQETGTFPYSKGDKSETVKEIHQKLKELGYYSYGSVNNYFGSITEAAVKKFQSENGLAVTGRVDEATYNLMFSEGAKYFDQDDASVPKTTDDGTYRLGDEAEAVAEIQERLKELGYYSYSNVTNYYGTITQNAVRIFQRANGIKADGVCGAATYEKIFADSAVSLEAYIAAGGDPYSTRDDTIDSIIAYAKNYLGCPYVYGGAGPRVFDCSGFTMYVYNHFGYSFGHGCSVQSNALGARLSVSQLMPGDLVFFDTNGGHNSLEHVGIYIGDGQFIHASSGKGRIIISGINESYYSTNFMWGKRVVPL